MQRLTTPAHAADEPARVSLRLDGEELNAREGDSVAVALLAAGERVLSRSIKYHRPRGFFCLAGHCGACLMRVDGRPNVKACQTPVRDGLQLERQNAFPSGDFDILAAADFFFSKGMDHHTMMTSPRPLNAVLQKVVRQLGGLGKLPDPPARALSDLPLPRALDVDVAVIGGGPAGLGAATACARAGLRVVLVDEQDRPGGSWLAYPDGGLGAAAHAVDEARTAGVTLVSAATAIGWYPEDAPHASAAPGLLAVHVRGGGDGGHDEEPHLLKLSAAHYVYATGAYDQNALFVDNDRPGILPARAVGRLLARFGLLPGKRPLVVGDGPYARALETALAAAGAAVTRVDGHAERVTAAHGHRWVKGVDLMRAGEKRARTLRCDLVAVAALPAPASELPRQHGVDVAFDVALGGFACQVDGDGRSARPGVWACGDVTGFRGPDEAAAAGRRTGAAVAAALGRSIEAHQ